MVKEAILGDMKIEYEAVERPVKYPRIEFKTGKLMLIVPKSFQEEKELLEKKREWIVKKAREIESAKKRAREKSGKKNHELSAEEFRGLVNALVERYSDILGVRPNRTFFKTMITKWASCSSRRNLTFNKDMRFLPRHLIKYVVFHEMSHLIERKHGEEFWRIIQNEFPQYGRKEKELLEYWFLIQEFKDDSLQTSQG
jgi:predicted metal-dependent hydrolase